MQLSVLSKTRNCSLVDLLWLMILETNGLWTLEIGMDFERLETSKPLCLLWLFLLLTRSDRWSWGTLYRGSKSMCPWHTRDIGAVLFRTGGDLRSHHEQITRHGVGQRRWSSLTPYTQKQPCTCARQTYLCRDGKESTDWRSFWFFFKNNEKYCFASQNSLLEWELNWRWW